jgi:uroporphyrinogen-III decarboxylase
VSVADVVARRRPERIAYAPNYWQWFAHHRNHGLLPPEAAGCRDQLELIERLGLEVFSRNVYCDERRGWWGGLCEETWNGAARERLDGQDLVTERSYGRLSERLRYVFRESTLVQEKHAVDDYANQLDDLAALLASRRWRFSRERFAAIQGRAGAGVVVAGELTGPLKMLYVLLGPQDATYCLMDYPERTRELLALHEAAQLELVRQMAQSGVRVMMAMDNLDTAFHPPHYVEKYSASFYEKASRICHEHGSLFFIHACGHQRDNLPLLASLGVDGLEGVAYPTLGDVELDEAMRLSGERMILTGGISAQEFERLRTREAVFAYVRELFARLRPYAHRFMFSASCNTPYTAPWETIVWFRDAWREYAAV